MVEIRKVCPFSHELLGEGELFELQISGAQRQREQQGRDEQFGHGGWNGTELEGVILQGTGVCKFNP